MSEPSHPHRSHTCGELRPEHIGQRVKLSGWAYRVRDQKHNVFIDLRDHYGVTQLTFDDSQPELIARAREVRPESVLRVVGNVVAREKPNPKLETGEVELRVERLEVESPCETLPIQVQIPKGESDRADEEGRLRWRFLDLRRERLHRNIVLRDQVVRHMRDHMHAEGFVEFQTPILTNSSPEGARDYLVPSRLHPGQFYALPQAPQQWKQMLMASGFDKYFQIAPCFRDEDARADRAPGEFYQLDMEMAYVTQEDVFGVIERMYAALPEKVQVPGASPKRVQQFPFPRIPYWDAIDRFGTDKPELRFGLELCDVSDLFASSSFALFSDAIGLGGRVKALRIPGGAREGKGAVRRLEKHVKDLGYGGLPHLIYGDDEVGGSIAKQTTPEERAGIRERLQCASGDLVVFGCGSRAAAAKVLGEVRLEVARQRSRGLSVREVGEVFAKTRQPTLRAAIDAGGYVKAFRISRLALAGRDWRSILGEEAVRAGEDGTAVLVSAWEKKGPTEGPLREALHPKVLKTFEKLVGCAEGDVVAIAAGTSEGSSRALSELRSRACQALDLPDPDVLAFCFIVDYPFYELDEEGQLAFSHNPFSMPQGGLEALETQDPLDVLAWQYDICCNGVELSSGAIRNHRPEIMYRAFEKVGYTREQVDTEFGMMIKAFKHGAPPHGGMAPGVDRTVMLLLDEPNIREVVAFPKNQRCQDLLAGAPGYVYDRQLRELGLRIDLSAHGTRCPHCGTEAPPREHVDAHGYRRVGCDRCIPGASEA
ncbi:MAG: aspartate--tRNA ligase [Planctomycetota bacterium]|nr:MAG: aspartate--tRNA ligase [Planctomycetota bacterium]